MEESGGQLGGESGLSGMRAPMSNVQVTLEIHQFIVRATRQRQVQNLRECWKIYLSCP